MPDLHPAIPYQEQRVHGNIVAGSLNVVGRDIVTTYLTGLRQLRPRPIDPEILMPSDRFVSPPGFGRAAQAVLPGPEPCSVLVLRAPGSHGRRSAALRVLAATSVRREQVFELAPDWDTPDVASLPEEPNAGYLLNLRGVTQPLPDQFYEDVVAYAANLRKRESYLVVTATAEIWLRTWTDVQRTGIVVADLGLPNPVHIVEKYLGSQPAASDRVPWITDPGSGFSQILPMDSSPSDAVRLAEIIAKAAGPNDEERIDEYCGWRDRLGRWFSGEREGVEARAIRIAGAFLNTAPASVVLDCADLLLREPEINLPPQEGGLLARPDARNRLKLADMLFDPASGTAELIHQSQAAAIVEYLWKEHTQLAQVVTRWLKKIGEGPARDNLTTLAGSLVKLAETAGVDSVLELAEEWLRQDDDDTVGLVGQLISDLAVHQTLGSRVRSEMAKWAGGKSQAARQRAVARAISGRFGSAYPSQALTRARYLLSSPGSEKVTRDALLSVRNLASTPALTALTVDTVVKWITPVADRTTAVEAAVFLDVFAPVSASPSACAPLRAALTQRGEIERVIHKRLLDGWVQVIKHGPQASRATEVLLEWRRTAEVGLVPRGPVVDMIVAIGQRAGTVTPLIAQVVGADGPLRSTLIEALFAMHEKFYDQSSQIAAVATQDVEEEEGYGEGFEQAGDRT